MCHLHHKHLPGKKGGKEGIIGTNNGNLGDRAQLRPSEEGEGSMVGCPFGAGPYPAFYLDACIPSQLPIAPALCIGIVLGSDPFGHNVSATWSSLERPGRSHGVVRTPKTLQRKSIGMLHAVMPDLARSHAQASSLAYTESRSYYLVHLSICLYPKGSHQSPCSAATARVARSRN